MKITPFLFAFIGAIAISSCQNTTEKAPILSVANHDNVDAACTTENAAQYMGKKIKVVGTVKSTFYADNEKGSPTFLNLDKTFPDNKLTVVVFKPEADKLRFNRFKYQNKKIEITGRIEQYIDEYGQVRPCIHIKEEGQLAIL